MTQMRVRISIFTCIVCLVWVLRTQASADTVDKLSAIDTEMGLTMGAMQLSSGEEVLQAVTRGADLELSYPLADRRRIFLNFGVRGGSLSSESRGRKRELAPQTGIGLVSADLGGQQRIGNSKWNVDVGLGLNAAGMLSSTTFSYTEIGLQVGAGISRWFALSDSFRIGAKLRTKVLSVRDVRDRWSGQSIEISLSAGYY